MCPTLLRCPSVSWWWTGGQACCFYSISGSSVAEQWWRNFGSVHNRQWASQSVCVSMFEQKKCIMYNSKIFFRWFPTAGHCEVTCTILEHTRPFRSFSCVFSPSKNELTLIHYYIVFNWSRGFLFLLLTFLKLFFSRYITLHHQIPLA